MKKLISLFLCALLVMSLTVSAFATEATNVDASIQTAGDTTGGDTSGGTTGGETSGGTTGGETSGDTTGGDTTGGTTGGDTTDGTTGGDTTDGTTGGDTTGGTTGGDTTGGTTGDTTGGTTGGDTTGGTTGGDTTGGTTGGDTTGGTTGGDTSGGTTGGDTTGGTTGGNPCANGHTWITVTIPATCKEEGAKGTACGVCAAVLEAEVIPKLTTHTYDNACDTDCNVCGLVREITHKYNTAWSRNSQEHWHACSVCGNKNDVGKHYPGPAATEEKAQTCLTCGLTLTPKLNHTHKYETKWSSNDAGHWYACSGCQEEKDYAKHVFDNACDPDCNVCGYRTGAEHDFGNTMESDESGHWGTCSICGEEASPVPHTPGPEATETEAQTCTVCGFELAPPTVHVHEAGLNWKADNDGHWKECECGEKLEAASHNWDEGTENEDTTVTYVCADCGAERTEGTPKEAGGFPWGIVLIVLILVAAGAGTALFFVLRKDKEALFD